MKGCLGIGLVGSGERGTIGSDGFVFAQVMLLGCCFLFVFSRYCLGEGACGCCDTRLPWCYYVIFLFPAHI